MSSNLFLEKFEQYINQESVTLNLKKPLSIIDLLTEISNWSSGDYVLYKVPGNGTFAIYDVKEEQTIYGYVYELSGPNKTKTLPFTKKLENSVQYKIVVNKTDCVEPLEFEKFIEKVTKNIFIILYGSNDLVKMKEECDVRILVDNL